MAKMNFIRNTIFVRPAEMEIWNEMKLKSKCLDGTIAAFVSIYKIWTKMPM
jgi:hypothetical protein